MTSQSDNDSTQTPADAPIAPPEIVVLNRDLFFGVKIGNTLRALGYRVRIVPTTEKFAAALDERDPGQALAVIDMGAAPDWDLVGNVTTDNGPGVPVLVFGSHLDVEGRRAAKAAGVARVLSNGDFHRDMVGFVRRYARATPGQAATSVEAQP